MVDEHDLLALVEAYIDGDTLARKALVDALDEAGDPRGDRVRDEAINWAAVARRIRKAATNGHESTSDAYLLFQIDCARFGSTTTPEVSEAVRTARRAFARKLFPQLRL